VTQIDIPSSAAEIDAAWLGHALAPRHPGVRVRSVCVRARQEWTNAHAWLAVDYAESAGAPPTLFCKLLPADARRSAVAATGMGIREARFYEALAPSLALRTPEVHAVDSDCASGAFVLLLEDLFAGGCTVSDGPSGIAPRAAARALEELAQLHVRFEDPTRRTAEAPWVPPPPSSDNDYGARMLRYGLEHHRGRLSARFAALAELYIAERAALHEVWAAGDDPTTVVHGDAHIGNLFDDRGRIGFLDWGMLQLGHGLRDASYFLTMSLTPADRRAHERDLLGHYLAAREAQGGLPIGFDAAWDAHRLYTSYAVVACCQVVTFPENATPKRRIFAESLLSRAEAAIEDLEVREALRDAGI
jgi:aminoglycoside phosphotransferase (APT) family kinase protein